MDDTTVSEEIGVGDDIYYLQCLKDETKKLAGHLLNQSGLENFADATDLRAVINRAQFRKVSTNADEVKKEIIYFIDKLNDIQQITNKKEIVESGGIPNNNRGKTQTAKLSVLSSGRTINNCEFINDDYDDADDENDDGGKVRVNADEENGEIKYSKDKLDKIEQEAYKTETTDYVDMSQNNRDALTSKVSDSVTPSDKIFNEYVSVNDAYNANDDVSRIEQRDDSAMGYETEQTELMPSDKDNGEDVNEFYDRCAPRDKYKELPSASFDQADGNRTGTPYDSLPNDRDITTGKGKELPETSYAKEDITGLNKRSPKEPNIDKVINRQLKKSGQKHLLYRDEIVKPHCELKNELQSVMVMTPPTSQFPKATEHTDIPYNVYEMDWKNVKSNSDVLVCRSYNITDRNWIDVILFADYYLVTIQKKVPTQKAHEYLNKYDKKTGELKKWILLPDAGKMCKINEQGLVAVLQIRRQNRCIAVVDTCQHKFRGATHELRVLYRFNVPELYSDLCCLGQLKNMCFQSEPYPCFEFAAVFGAQGQGKANEEIDILNPEVDKHCTRRINSIYIFESRKSKLLRKNGICSIDALSSDRIVLSLNYGIACIDLNGKPIWYMPTDSRVTDICCYNNDIFACLPDNGQILKIYTQNYKCINQDKNLIEGEHITPSQVSACQNEILIREFIQNDYKSEVLIKVIEPK